MAQKRPVAPDTPIVSYPTPQVSDVIITVDVDSRLPGYKTLEYGSLYSDQTKFPGAKLVSQAPLEDDRFVRRVYATDRVNQDTYNYGIKYSAGSPDYPIYTRITLELRDKYKPLEDNSPDALIPGAYLVDEEASPADGELNSLYLKVVRVFETLPGPWVPYSRYDDDLGPIRGRKRSVINQGQVASLTANTRTTYEARDNSTGVYIETEESWDIGSGGTENGESPFPIKERDLYDERLGPVKETRQLFAITGNEQASLVYQDSKIIRTDYDIYNQYLVVKIISSYAIPCPERVRDVYDPILGSVQEVSQVIHDTKDLEGSIIFNNTVGENDGVGVVTETAYQPVNTLATERVVRTYSVPAPDRRETLYDPVKGAISRVSKAVKDDGGVSFLSVSENGIATEIRRQPINSIVVDFITETYSLTSAPLLKGQQYEEDLDVVFPFQQQAVDATTVDFPTSQTQFEPIDRAHSVKRAYDFDVVNSQLDNFYWSCPDLIRLELPDILLSATLFLQISQGYDNSKGDGDTYYWKSSATSAISGDLVYDIQKGYDGLAPAIRSIFFIKKNVTNITGGILAKLATNGVRATVYPYVKTIEHTIAMTGGTQQANKTKSKSASYDGADSGSESDGSEFSVTTQVTKIPPTLHDEIPINISTNAIDNSLKEGSVVVNIPPFCLSVSAPPFRNPRTGLFEQGTQTLVVKDGDPDSAIDTKISIPSTDPPSFPVGKYVMSITASPYRFGYTKIETVVVDVLSIYVKKADGVLNPVYNSSIYAPQILTVPQTYSGTIGVPFSATLEYIWAENISVTTTPAGSWLSYSQSNFKLSGTPTAAGKFVLPVTCTNQFGSYATTTVTIIISTPS